MAGREPMRSLYNLILHEASASRGVLAWLRLCGAERMHVGRHIHSVAIGRSEVAKPYVRAQASGMRRLASIVDCA